MMRLNCCERVLMRFAALCVLLLSMTCVAQGVVVLDGSSSEIKSRLNIFRDESGFKSCGIFTSIAVGPSVADPVEALTVALVVGLTKNDESLGTMVKIKNFIVPAGGKRVVNRTPTAIRIGKATASKQFEVRRFTASSEGAWLGTGPADTGMDAMLALASGEHSLQLLMPVKEKSVERIFQFRPPPISPDEFSVLISCLEFMAKRVGDARQQFELDANDGISEVGIRCRDGEELQCLSLRNALVKGDKSISIADARVGMMWLKKSCDKLPLEHCSSLGVAHLSGVAPQRFERAATAFAAGCEAGDWRGCDNLAALVRAGWVKGTWAAASLENRACALDTKRCKNHSRTDGGQR